MSTEPTKRSLRIKAIIFDLDGTLLNTLTDIADAMNHVLLAKGLPSHPTELYRSFVGNGLERLIERALPQQMATPESIRIYLSAFRAAYARNWRATTRPYPGIPDLLTRLRKQGIHLSILSNKAHEFTTQMAATLLAEWTFNPVIGAGSRFPKKPDPTAALHIIEELNLDGGECLFVGDSGVDMQTANSAGLFPVGVTWGFRSEEELLENGCGFIARHPLDICSLLEPS